MNHLTRQFLITGEVQGVGYRAFACRAAAGLGVTGWTRNLGDGRVEVLAQGAADPLARFEARLREGPPHGRVDDVATSARADVTEVFTEFEQRKDGAEPCTAV